jgi:hypothetical protein
MKPLRRRLTYANVMSSIAVFLVVAGGTAFAATKIGSNEIKANAIITGKIKKEAVTEGKIKAGGIGNSRLANEAVTANKLAANSVTGSALADASVASTKLANNAVTASKLAANSVTGSALADGSVTTGKLADNAVTTGKLANASVTPEKLSQQYLPVATEGVPVAGANIASNGTVRKFFNRAGGAPTVTHTAASGSYNITFPGLEGQAFFTNSIVLVTLNGGNPGEISRASATGNPQVRTWTSAGAPTDAEFEIVIVSPGS